MSDLEARLAGVREFAASSPYYQALGLSPAEIAAGRVVLLQLTGLGGRRTIVFRS